MTAIYVRVSTEEQAREGYSIRAQEEKLRTYAAIKDWQIHAVYADEGISAKDIEGRPAIKRLIADISARRISNVLVYKIDRLTRSTKNLIELIDLFNAHNCAFNSLNESIDTSSATGRMFLKIMGIFAEFERENLAERVRLGCERKVKEGFTPATICQSYGYTREPGERIQTIHPQEAETVKRIFNMYLQENQTLSQIARTLTAEKIPTKHGKKWSIPAIKLIITNPNYIGKVRYSITDQSRYFEAEGKHEPIIPVATFHAAAQKLARTKAATPTKRPHPAAYFCGILHCAECGSKYTTKWNKKNVSYRCANAVKKKCHQKSIISHNKLRQAFEAYISEKDKQKTVKNITVHKELHKSDRFGIVVIDEVVFDEV